MRAKQKNILIGGLLAVVFMMAVGYAAFATQLNINGSASVNSTWNVHFDTSKTGTLSGGGVDTSVISKAAGLEGADEPSNGTITYDGDVTATISSATLIQPGDWIEYTLTILNEGSFAADIDSVVLSIDGGTVATGALEGTKGNIKYTVTPPTKTLAKKNGSVIDSDVVKVRAEFMDNDITHKITGNGKIDQTAVAHITLGYVQA